MVPLTSRSCIVPACRGAGRRGEAEVLLCTGFAGRSIPPSRASLHRHWLQMAANVATLPAAPRPPLRAPASAAAGSRSGVARRGRPGSGTARSPRSGCWRPWAAGLRRGGGRAEGNITGSDHVHMRSAKKTTCRDGPWKLSRRSRQAPPPPSKQASNPAHPGRASRRRRPVAARRPRASGAPLQIGAARARGKGRANMSKRICADGHNSSCR